MLALASAFDRGSFPGGRPSARSTPSFPMTISTLGTVTILLLFLMTLATASMAALAAHRRSERLVEGATSGMHAIFGLAAFASALLVYAFLAGDYSIQYVQHNGHPAMPVF